MNLIKVAEVSGIVNALVESDIIKIANEDVFETTVLKIAEDLADDTSFDDVFNKVALEIGHLFRTRGGILKDIQNAHPKIFGEGFFAKRRNKKFLDKLFTKKELYNLKKLPREDIIESLNKRRSDVANLSVDARAPLKEKASEAGGLLSNNNK